MAKSMLSIPGLSIENIALNCGFYDTQHFYKTFKKYVGISPSDYRKSIIESVKQGTEGESTIAE